MDAHLRHEQTWAGRLQPGQLLTEPLFDQAGLAHADSPQLGKGLPETFGFGQADQVDSRVVLELQALANMLESPGKASNVIDQANLASLLARVDAPRAISSSFANSMPLPLAALETNAS